MANTTTDHINKINTIYPVSGIDNDSQGFRDNFTSIKEALNSANDDITNLQLYGVTTTGANDFGQNLIKQAQLQNCSIYVFDDSAVPVTGDVVIDYRNGSYQKISLAAGTHNISVSNWPGTNKSGFLTLSVTTSTEYSTYVNFTGGSVINLSAEEQPILISQDGDPTIFDIHSDGSSDTLLIKRVNDRTIVTITSLIGIVTATTGSSLIGDVIGIVTATAGSSLIGNVIGVVTATAGSSLIGNVIGVVTATTGSSLIGNVIGIVTATAGSSLIGNVLATFVTATNIHSNNLTFVSEATVTTSSIWVGDDTLNVDGIKNISVENTATITTTIISNSGPGAGYDSTLTLSSIVGVTTATTFSVGTNTTKHTILSINTVTNEITTDPYLSSTSTNITFYRERTGVVFYATLPPETSAGSFGDRAGTMVATTNSVYICFSDYVDTSTNIWGKLDFDSTSW